MKDLTKGYPAKVILLFAVPLIIGNILQQLYNMIDTKIVSTYVDTLALASVGATAVVSNTLIGLLNGLTQGFAILVAQSFGAKDDKRMRNFIAGSILLTVIATILIMSAGFIWIEPILKLLGTPADILDSALAYVRVILIGTVFCSIYNLCANLYRAVGDSKTPLFCLIMSVVMNTLLDILFVAVFHWGIKGAAWATIISQALCATVCLTYGLFKYRFLIPKKGEWHLKRSRLMNLITTGLSMGFMGCIVNIGTVVLQSAINALGTKVVAAHTAGRRVMEILMVVIYTIGFAMTTFVSQNMGAGNTARVRQGVRHAILIVSIETTVLIILTYLFGRPVVTWIANTTDQEIIENGVMYLRVGILFFYVLGALFVLRCSLQGMGRKIIPICSSFLELLIKVLSASFLVPALAYFGVSLTEPVSWVIMTIPLIIAYFLYWKKNPALDHAVSTQGNGLNS